MQHAITGKNPFKYGPIIQIFALKFDVIQEKTIWK